MDTVYAVRNPGHVLLAWSPDEKEALFAARDIQAEFDIEAAVREEAYDDAEHGDSERIVLTPGELRELQSFLDEG